MDTENPEDTLEQRKIIHIDMDAFYASVEQRDYPEYQGKPVVVGGTPEQRGVVAACSYEARKFGIHSAMPAAQAHQRCPQAIFLRPRFTVYREVSSEIQAVFHQFTDLVEPLSLDEAYLDVTHNQEFSGSATLIAKEIKRLIKEKTNLNASAGVSYNKFLAKIASDMDKPDGLYLITPEQGPEFIKKLPIRQFHGIGKATEARMKAFGIHTGDDLRQKELNELVNNFGKAGHFYYSIARGIDLRPVNNQRQRKSLGKETTFSQDMGDRDEMFKILDELSNSVSRTLFKKQLIAQTITLKVKYADFELITRSRTVEKPTQAASKITKVVKELLTKTEAGQRKVRLLGVTTSKLEEKVLQLTDKTEQMDLL
jgi:DNA polymerase IV